MRWPDETASAFSPTLRNIQVPAMLKSSAEFNFRVAIHDPLLNETVPDELNVRTLLDERFGQAHKGSPPSHRLRTEPSGADGV